ncbi:hypothetical protein ANO14919_099510 [Xylariales sp. No.14919]|nr:hypothetical protein ANO14919_099510 [Xylariales sp. No.14919]
MLKTDGGFASAANQKSKAILMTFVTLTFARKEAKIQRTTAHRAKTGLCLHYR